MRGIVKNQIPSFVNKPKGPIRRAERSWEDEYGSGPARNTHQSSEEALHNMGN